MTAHRWPLDHEPSKSSVIRRDGGVAARRGTVYDSGHAKGRERGRPA